MLCKDIKLEDNFNYNKISQLTPGYVGADLNSLVREAAMLAVNKIFATLENNLVKSSHTEEETTLVAAESGKGILLVTDLMRLHLPEKIS